MRCKSPLVITLSVGFFFFVLFVCFLLLFLLLGISQIFFACVFQKIASGETKKSRIKKKKKMYFFKMDDRVESTMKGIRKLYV